MNDETKAAILNGAGGRVVGRGRRETLTASDFTEQRAPFRENWSDRVVERCRPDDSATSKN